MDIMDYEPTDATKKETLQAYSRFFKKLFDVDIQNKDGSYKSTYNIFEESFGIKLRWYQQLWLQGYHKSLKLKEYCATRFGYFIKWR